MRLSHLFLFVGVIFFAAVVLRIGCAIVPAESRHTAEHKTEDIDFYYVICEKDFTTVRKLGVDGEVYLVIRSSQGVAMIKHEPKDSNELQETQEKMD